MTTFNTQKPASILVIFGGQDSEEQAAREVASKLGYSLATATFGGEPVHSGNAYRADDFSITDGDGTPIEKVIIFECSPAVAGELEVVKTCDHHNPGDFGYNFGPEKFWEGSSLGQLCSFIGSEKTHELELVAAGDHCPVQAYLGNCPGIDKEEFLVHRILGKVDFYKNNPRFEDKDFSRIKQEISLAQEVLENAPDVDGVKDLRGAGVVEELPEAAMSLGHAYMAAIPDTDRDRKPTGNTKIVLGGHTTPETVEKFMEWGNSLHNRVGDSYGNPTRGFAGVIVKP